MPDRFGKISIHSTDPATLGTKEGIQSPPVPPKTSTQKSPARKYSRSLLVWLGVTVLLVTLYNAIGFLGIPYYLSSSLPESFNKATGLRLDPGSISFNPLTFKFDIEKARIFNEKGVPILSLQNLSASIAPLSFLRLDLVCNSVALNELEIDIIREQDGTYNFDQLLRSKQDGKNPDILKFSDLPFFFSLNNIAIRNSKILFQDIPTSKQHTVEKIQLDLPTLSNIPFRANEYIRPSFSAVVNGSLVELTGQANMSGSGGSATNLSINLHALELPTYVEYLPFEVPLVIAKGKTDGKINLFFDPEGKQEDKLSLDFEFQVTETELYNTDESLFIFAPVSEIKGKVLPIAKTLIVSNISLKEPIFSTLGPSILSSIGSIARNEKKSSTSGLTPESPFSITINELLFENGVFNHFSDKEAKKPNATWKALQLNVKNFASPLPIDAKQAPCSFLLNGKKEGTSPSSFSWQGDLTSLEVISGKLNLEKFDLKELLMSIGTDENLAVKGFADLTGHLTLSQNKDPGANIGYKINDAKIVVNNFQLFDNNQILLSAPKLNITSLGTIYKTINFGNVSIENGTASFAIGRTPELFQQVTNGKYLIQGIDFNGQVSFIQEGKGKQKITYPNVTLKTNNLDTPEKAKDNFNIFIKTATSGDVEGHGDMRLAPFSLSCKTEFNALSTDDVFPITTRSNLLNNLIATFSGKGLVSLPQKNYSGDLRLTKGSFRKTQELSFSWSDMLFQEVNYSAEPFHLGIAMSTISQPQLSWHISENDPDPMHQLASFLQRNIPTAEPEKQPLDKQKITISPVDIQEIQFSQGKVSIQDNRLKPKWKNDISELVGKIKDIHFTESGSTSEFSFLGKLVESPLSITGSSDLYSREHNGKFRLTLDNFPISSFHEQLSSLGEVDTKNGMATLILDASWQENQYKKSGSLAFAGIKAVSEKSDTAITLAMLTGADEKFQLDFNFTSVPPVGKSVFLEEILALFQTQVVKASVSPLLLATGDFKDLIGNEFAEFVPGKEILTEQSLDVLKRYSTLLETHPRAGIDLSGGVDREIDAPAIKTELEALELLRIETENRKRYEAWLKEKTIFEQKVEERQKKQAANKGKPPENVLPPAVLKDYIALQPKPIIIDDVMLLELAKKRTQAVAKYIESQLSLQPGRITIIPSKKSANNQPGQQGNNSVKISLKAVQ